MRRPSLGGSLRAVALLMGLCLLAACAGGGPATPSAVEDWPQYRGARRDGVAAAAASQPLSWPEEGPKVVWKHPAGQAFSQLALQGDAAYTTVSDEERSYAVRLDAGTGEELWRQDLGEVFTEQMGNGPRATPTLDGDRVYVPSARGVLHALNAVDGAVIWSVDLKEKFDTPQPRFGFSPSPLIAGELLILEAGGKEEEKAMVALDKGTGEVRWSGLTGAGGYSSPILAGFSGVDQIVLPRGKTVTALSLEGEVLWTFDMEEGVIAMPVQVGDDKLFISASGDTGCALIRITRG